MRRNNIRKTEALIMAFALSASLLLTGCGNSTGSKNTASNNASIVSSSNSVDNNNGSGDNKILMVTVLMGTAVQQMKLELITIIR